MELEVIAPIISNIEEKVDIPHFCTFVFKCRRCDIDVVYFMSYGKPFPIFCFNCNTLLIFTGNEESL